MVRIAAVETSVTAPLARVRAEWCTDRLARWWWPMFQDTTYDFSPCAGRPFAIRSRAGGSSVTGRFLDIDEDFLVLSWVWAGPSGPEPPERVTVSFAMPIMPPYGTALRVAQTVRPDTHDRVTARWRDLVGRLSALHVAA